MNYELKYIDNSFMSSVGESRRIKLRKLSFANVSNIWKNLLNSITSNFSSQDTTDIDTNITNSEESIDNSIKRLETYTGDLNNEVFIIDTKYREVKTLKRRVLAISEEMYNNINNNVSKVFTEDIKSDSVGIDESEIRKAVKDAFDQIEFDEPVDSDIVITPEEVSNTVVSYDNDSEEAPEEFNSNDYENEESKLQEEYNNTEIDSQELNENQFSVDNGIFNSFEDEEVDEDNNTDDIQYNETEPLFNFEDINFDTIDIDENDIEENVNEEFNESIEEYSSSPELDDIIAEAKELKAKKDEQDKKTEAARSLAEEKEDEKEKIKADFVAYKNTIEEELNKSKQLEQENLERARKAEEFTTALSDIMK